MVKADAYGHGSSWVASQLDHLPELYAFGVATLPEGQKLRTDLGGRTPIIVFSGATPFHHTAGEICQKHGLIPVISSAKDFDLFCRQGWHTKIRYHLKFDTGMHRLGIAEENWQKVIAQAQRLPAHQQPQGVLTHLAQSETPTHRFSRLQFRRVQDLRSQVDSLVNSGCRFHYANSAAIWKNREWKLQGLGHLIRPGVGLYGVPPWPKAPRSKCAPVLSFQARVIQIKTLAPGEAIGYGSSYIHPRSSLQAKRVALLGVGYADGVARLWSNRAHAWVSGRKREFVGTISMDLCAVAAGPKTKVNDWVELFGAKIDPWQQASAAGTIPYEILTSVSNRVKRIPTR